jgi:acetyl esterase/lipase
MKYKTRCLTIVYAIISFCLITSCSNSTQENFEDVSWTFENVPYGEDKNQTFNIIMPEWKSNVHVIVYLHGGFYYSGNKLWYPLFLTDFSENDIFVTMDYRLIGTNNIHMNDMITDVDNALKKIKDFSTEKGYNINDFILVGHSAGAHIGLLYGYKYFQENSNRQIKIAACVSLAGPTDYTDDVGWSSMKYYGETLEERLSVLSWLGTVLTGYEIELTQYDWTKQNNWTEYENHANEISPIKYIQKTDKIPPTLLVHGPDDKIVPYSNSVKLNSALENISIPHKLITVTGSGNNHMLGGEPNRTDSIKPIKYKEQVWINEVKAWIETYLQQWKYRKGFNGA